MRKHSIITTLSLLVLCPMMMANSPAPRRIQTAYEDYDIKIEYKGIDDDRTSKKHVYEATVNNYGDLYLDEESDLTFVDQSHNQISVELEGANKYFPHQAIAPHSSKTFKFYYSNKIDASEHLYYQSYCYASPAEEIEFSNSEIKKYREGEFTYILKTDVKNMDKNDDLIVFVHATYKDEDLIFYIPFHYRDRTFELSQALDVDNLKVNKVVAYWNNYSNSGCNDAYETLQIIGIVMIVCIAASIIIPISITTSVRNRRRNRQQ